MDLHSIAYLVAAFLIVLGIVGTALLMPGVPVVFAGMLLAAWADDFRVIPLWAIGVLAALTVLALAIDFVATLLGARRVGASRHALVGAALGTLVGLFFGIPGLLLGPFLGALCGELLHGRDLAQASRVGAGTWIGMIAGAVFKLALCFVMLAVFVFAIAAH
jgi:uncharacterized protein YqgC (DUF456 family)